MDNCYTTSFCISIGLFIGLILANAPPIIYIISMTLISAEVLHCYFKIKKDYSQFIAIVLSLFIGVVSLILIKIAEYYLVDISKYSLLFRGLRIAIAAMYIGLYCFEIVKNILLERKFTRNP